MTRPKHSPAPWWHDEAHCAIRYRLPSGHPDLYSDDPEMDDGARNVVSLIGACGGTDSSADVALMTAAPDLLAAVKSALAFIEADTPACEPGTCIGEIRILDLHTGEPRVIDLSSLRAAIAKAEASDA